MNAWAQQGRDTSVEFRGGVVGIGEIAPSSTWHTSHEEAGWASTEVAEPGDSKVVFFGGLYFNYRRLAAILPQSHMFRLGPVEKAKFRDVDPEGKDFRIFDHETCDDGLDETLGTSEELGELIDLPSSPRVRTLTARMTFDMSENISRIVSRELSRSFIPGLSDGGYCGSATQRAPGGMINIRLSRLTRALLAPESPGSYSALT